MTKTKLSYYEALRAKNVCEEVYMNAFKEPAK